ncbi:MAG: UbiH/UbiF/VisC/COQ6 family ubiquinone biosynthesis hydroxylase [Gammaproteobacteria bacterium]|nr:UbiH/UbiF/VisC/COQ6 family ubiquinone biosynthesis hydroxylase [Gammaproteobacteria bacterium]
MTSNQEANKVEHSANAAAVADIVIVGGGPVGLATACLLSETGLKVVLVNAEQEVLTTAELKEISGKPDFDTRVSALTVASENLFENIGAWEAVSAVRACPYQNMEVWDGEGTGSIHFAAADLHADTLGHIVENRLMISALFEQASTKPNLELLQGISVKEITVNEQPKNQIFSQIGLELSNGHRICARLLIGADGANSLVREQMGLSLRKWDYGHQAIVTTVMTEYHHQYTAWQRFMHSGPLAFLPLHLAGTDKSKQCYSSIVWSCVTEKAEGIKALSDSEFMPALGEAFEFKLGKVLECGPRFSFPLYQRHAIEYVQDHVALVGDAAHTIHPLAGQGVNLGFSDAKVLSEVITEAIESGEDFASHRVLSRYQRRRKGQNLGMMGAMEGFKRLFGTDELALTWLRNTGLNLADHTPLIKKQLMRKAMGL